MKKIIALLLFALCMSQVYAAATSTSIQVTATLSSTCSISASNISFATIGITTSNVTSSNSSLVVKCSNKLPYTIGFSSGNQGNNTMKGTNKNETIPYAMCQQEGWSLNGSNLICNNKSWITSTMTGTGNGINQSYTVYGYVANGYYTPDNYTDSVTTTIWY